MKNHSIRLFVALAFVVATAPTWACGIVYGKDWAFLAETPLGWSSGCHKQAMEGTAITLWPAQQKPEASDAIIYVTVSTKDIPTLHDFASDARAVFKLAAPSVIVTELEAPAVSPKVKIELVAFSRAPPGDREEMVAYIEGPTAYFIVVLTAESAQALVTHKADFLSFVAKFIPMERR